MKGVFSKRESKANFGAHHFFTFIFFSSLFYGPSFFFESYPFFMLLFYEKGIEGTSLNRERNIHVHGTFANRHVNLVLGGKT